MENNYEVIDQFLADWKAKAKQFYIDEYAIYDKLYEEERAGRLKWNEEHPTEYCMSKVAKEFKIANREKLWSWCRARSQSEMGLLYDMHYAENPGSKADGYDEVLEKVLDKEVKHKKASFIKRVERTVGDIIDFNLRIGDDGSINGTATGLNESMAKVTTIYAGGYNIQCLHFRVLVKEIK